MASFNISLKTLTLNVQGLRKVKKRQALFRQFKLMNIDVICLQETYLVLDDIEFLEREWKGKFHISPGTKKSRGLLTLFNKSLDNFNISLVSTHERILNSSISFDKDTILISNIYSPCDTLHNRLSFFTSLENILVDLSDTQNYNLDNVIVLGDFNSCINNQLDIISGKPHPVTLTERFKSFVTHLNLNDIFRVKYPLQKTYTWSRKKVNEKRVSRRLDYVLLSDSLCC